MKILIDGYNLIFECGLHGRHITAQSLSKARTQLLQTIVSRSPSDILADVTVVFDARKQPLSGQQELDYFQQIRVLYSINFEEADELIEHLISKHASPKQLIVVSSDHRIHKAALRRKAKPVDSGDWYDELLSQKATQPPVVPPPDFKDNNPESLLTDQEMADFKAQIERDGLADEDDKFPFS